MPKRESVTCFCKKCNKQVEAQWEDVGIGSYEFWGARGTDVQWVLFCTECEEQLDSKNCVVNDSEPEYEPDLNNDILMQEEDDWDDDIQLSEEDWRKDR